MTPKQAAEETGVHAETIRRWIRSGKLEVQGKIAVGNMNAQLVAIEDVEELAKTAKPGRPPKDAD